MDCSAKKTNHNKSIATLEEWTKLQTFLKKKLYDKGLNTMEILRRKMCGRTFTQERLCRTTHIRGLVPSPMVVDQRIALV